MRRWLVAAAVAAITYLAAPFARAAPPEVDLSGPSPKRRVPDYDGRGPPRRPAADAALWVPRVVLSPAYLVTEYVVRQPLRVAVTAAEHEDLPRKVYDVFAFGPRHTAGVLPVALVEFNFNPSVGVYAFWDDAGFEGDHLRLHFETWPPDWVGGSLTQRVDIDPDRALQLRIAGVRRPDGVFYGSGPASVQSHQSRFGTDRVDGSATYAVRFWRGSQVSTALGMRDVRTYDGHYGGDPSLSAAVARGAFAAPDGFGQEYTAVYSRISLALDTRTPAVHLGSGTRVEVDAEQVSDVRDSPGAGWLRYAGTVAGYLDLTGHARVAGISVTALFADPLGRRPVSFLELPYLGGDHPMAAFFAERLVDRSAVAATASYAWPIGPWLDGRLELATGNVFGPHLGDFEAKSLRLSAAFGLSVAGLSDTPLELLVGVGTEPLAQGAPVDTARVMLGVPHTF